MPRSHSSSHGSSHSSEPEGGSSHPSSSSSSANGHSQVSFSTMENFGTHLSGVSDKVFSGAERMQSLNWGAHTFGVAGQALAPHTSATTSHAAEQMHSVGGSVSQASSNVHTMVNNYRTNEQNIQSSFNSIHNPDDEVHNPHATSRPPTPGPSAAPRPPRQVGFNPQTEEYGPDGTHTSGVLNGDGPSPRPSAPGLNPQSYQPTTGANSHSVTGPPEPGNHPLKVNDSGLSTASYLNSQNLVNQFDGQDGRPGKGKRPGMGGALLAGDNVIPHSSMKYNTGDPNRHSVVQNVLDNAPQHLQDRPQHGKCAEVGAISDYLHNQDPQGNWTVDQAKHHFDQVGGATTAHRPENNGEPADACPSCQYLTSQLGISWYTRPVWEAHG